MEPLNISSTRVKKKILFVHQNLVVGGAEELRLTLLKYMDRQKFDITVCSIENKGEISQEIQQLGFPVISLNRKCRFWDIRITIDLYNLIKKYRYDIVQTSLFYANLHGRIAAFMARVPIIISEEHNIYAWKNRYPIFILADKLLSAITDKIITCSDSVRKFTSRQEKIPLNKFLTIHNFIDFNKFSITQTKEQLRQQYGFKKDENIIVTVGILSEQKGHKYLLEAFKKIKESIANTRLLIVGSGPQEERLRLQAKLLNLGDSVIFMGLRRDVPELLKISDIFVLPSMWEGFGIVLLEAMISGLAVVATNVDGVPEVVLDGKTGLLVPPRDADRLTKGIAGLLLDKNHRIAFGLRARQYVLENFTPESYLNKLISLYNYCS